MIQSITSVQNRWVKHWVKLRTQRRYRKEQGVALVEGKNLIRDLLKQGCIKALMTEEESPAFVERQYRISAEVLQKITGVKNPEGWLAEVHIPAEKRLSSLRSLLVFEEMQDPGNMGTLLRTAWALGWEGVFFVHPCCDPFNDKALRAAKGASFFLPSEEGEWDRLEEVIEKNGLALVVADTKGESVDTFSPPERIALLLGNEAKGISERAQKRGVRVTIPMEDGVESLNVAAAGNILLYELRVYDDKEKRSSR